MPLATPGYLREIAALTSGNRDMYRNACKDAADEIERLAAQLADAEIGLMTWDDGRNSEYWLRYPERLGEDAPTAHSSDDRTPACTPAVSPEPSSVLAPRADSERMREALEPFAKYADKLDGINYVPDGCPLVGFPGGCGSLTVGHLRRARAALLPTPPATNSDAGQSTG